MDRRLGIEQQTAVRWFAALFAFACFLPYPALALGGSTGLQVSHAAALLVLPILVFVGMPARQLLSFSLLMFSLLASATFLLMTGRILSVHVMLGAVVGLMLLHVVIVPGGVLARSANLHASLAGVCAAILMHVGIGLFQLYSYRQEVFPLIWLYRNPAFLPIEGVASDAAFWTKRPFGLFPEPSAMAASIGPWLVLLIGLLLRRDLRSGFPPRLVTLMTVAGLSGTLLVIISKSGYTVPLLLAMAMLLLRAAKGRVTSGVSARTLLAALLLVPVLGLTVLFARDQLGKRLDLQSNDSWQARGQSIVVGLNALHGGLTMIVFGHGPGQSYPFIQRTQTSELLPSWFRTGEIKRVDAIWSVAGVWYAEMGMLGVLMLVIILSMVLSAILNSSASLIGLSALFAWLCGIIFTTSYQPLSPIWLFLGFLLEWDRLFARVPVPVTALSNRIGRARLATLEGRA
jgi:hypothetical protein